MERIVGTRRQNAEGKPLRCGEDSSLLADTPMRGPDAPEWDSWQKIVEQNA